MDFLVILLIISVSICVIIGIRQAGNTTDMPQPSIPHTFPSLIPDEVDFIQIGYGLAAIFRRVDNPHQMWITIGDDYLVVETVNTTLDDPTEYDNELLNANRAWRVVYDDEGKIKACPELSLTTLNSNWFSAERGKQ